MDRRAFRSKRYFLSLSISKVKEFAVNRTSRSKAMDADDVPGDMGALFDDERGEGDHITSLKPITPT